MKVLGPTNKTITYDEDPHLLPTFQPYIVVTSVTGAWCSIVYLI